MNELKIFLVVCLCAVLFNSGLSAKLPKTFKRCKVSKELDGKPNACLKDAVGDAVKKLASPQSKDIGVASLDPLKTESVYLERGENSPVAIKLNFTKNDLFGLASTTIRSVSGKISSPKDFNMFIELGIDEVSMEGQYTINGKVLILPIQGSGKSKMTFTDVDCTVRIKGESEIRNGKEYLKIKKTSVTILPKGTKSHFDNLFNGNKALGDNMNKFLNENWLTIYPELQGPLQSAFGAILQEHAKRILEKYPFNNIFITE